MGDQDSITIKKDKDGAYTLKFNVGGADKTMVVDSGYSGEVFVDADNFKKIKGKPGPKVPCVDAEDEKFDAESKVDVDVTLSELGITVKKYVLGLPKGGSNLIGSEYWPNLAGLAEANLDLVNGTLVIKKIKKAKAVKVPFLVPKEDVRGSTPRGDVVVKVPIIIAVEDIQDIEEQPPATGEEITDLIEPVKVPFPAPKETEEAQEVGGPSIKGRIKVPFKLPR
jgi:hypothetical protein